MGHDHVSSAGSPTPDEALADALRARGMRLTGPRRRIVAALSGLAHGTPEQVAETLAVDGGPSVPLSTVYRGLEALEGLGLVSHTHLDHRAPAYHLTAHADHIHLVCLSCSAVTSVPAETAASLAGNLRDLVGFEPDMTHMAIHGWCRACRAR